MANEGSEVARAFVKIGGDDSDLKKDLQKTQGGLFSWLGTVTGSIKKGLGGASALFGGLLGGLGIGGGALQIKEWVQAAIGAEAAGARFNAILQGQAGAAGYTTENMLALASSIAKVTNFSKGQVIQAEQTLLLFDKISPKNFEAALRAAADLATVLDTDLAEAARTVGIALQDPEHGMRGLRQAGITFTKDQKESLKKLIDSGDTAGAQNMILDRLKKLGPAAEAMANTTQGALKRLQKEWMGLGRGVGDALLPAIRAMIGEVSGFIGALKAPFAVMAQFISANKDALVTVAKWVGIGAGVVASLFALKAAIAGVAAVVGLVLSPVGLVVGLLAGAGLVAVQQFGLSWKDLMEILLTAVTNLPLVGEIFVTAMEMLLESADKFFNLEPGTLEKNFRVAFKVVGALAEALIQQISRAFEGLKEMADWAYRKLNGQPSRLEEQQAEQAKRTQRAEANLNQAVVEALVGGAVNVTANRIRREQVPQAEQLPMPKEEADAGRNLAGKMDELKKEFQRRRDDLRMQLDAKPLATQLEKAVGLIGGGIGVGGLRALPNGNGPPQEIKTKFSFVGLAEAWKKMQESISGGPMVELARKQLEVGGQQVAKLDEIKQAIDNKKFGDGDNEAVVAGG